MNDTIAAIATAAVPAAIGVLRVSGAGSAAVLDRVFRPLKGKPLSQRENRKMVLGSVLDREGRVIDQALAVFLRGPHSYTGEDGGEIHCHGSPIVLQEALMSLFAAGARQAKGGEFTQRAFLNGKMDLIQAEAVADLVDAETAEAARNAVGQLSGAVSRTVEESYGLLMDITSRFYAVVDYPDEDIEDLQRTEMETALRTAEEKLRRLLNTFERGCMMKTGVPTVILGKPNAGKSSLLNALLGYERAIVTDVAGTTRDTVEEKIMAGGTLLRLIDTAGIRPTHDTVERLGVERSREAAKRAELALLVLDGSRPLTEEDREAAAVAETAPRRIAVLNKCDLSRVMDEEAVRRRFPDAVCLSAKTGDGLEVLTARIAELFASDPVPAGEVLTNARQAEAIGRAVEAIGRAREALEQGITPDAVLTEAEQGLEALGELNGKNIREDLVATIFSRFCVGK